MSQDRLTRDHAAFVAGRGVGELPSLHPWEVQALIAFMLYYMRPEERAILHRYLPETYDKIHGKRIPREPSPDVDPVYKDRDP